MDKEKAMEVVKELKAITQSDISLVNKEGIIVASTDLKALDTFHEAAKTVIDTNVKKLIAYDTYTYKGTRNSVNMAISIYGNICGVVSIDGSSSEIVRLGEVVKRMTEILLLENQVIDESLLNKKMLEDFVIDWIFSNSREGISLRGARLGINTSKQWRIILLKIEDFVYKFKYNEGKILLETIEKDIRETLNNPESILVLMNNDSTFILMVSEMYQNKMLEFAHTIHDIVLKKLNLLLLIGIDEKVELLRDSFQKADRALKRSFASKPITIYKDLYLETFIYEISVDVKNEFVSKVFKNYSEKDMKKDFKLLKAYFETNGSLTKTAENMRVHINTLQYQLKNLHEKTGLDPRTVTGATLFQLAIEFHDSL